MDFADFGMYIIITVVITIMFYLVMIENKRYGKKNTDENHFTVRSPKIYLLVGILSTLFGCVCLILMTMFPNDTVNLLTFGFFLLWTILSLVFFIYLNTWKLKVDGDQITYCPFIGI